MRGFLLILKRNLRSLKVHHYVVFAAVLGVGVFNAVTALSPTIQQNKLEKSIAADFDSWWRTEGIEKFKSVGLPADENTRAQEFEQYRERILNAGKTFLVEERIVAMRKEFREWWEIGGGKEEYIQEHGNYPKEAEFKEELRKYIKNFTNKFPRYNMAFVPSEGEYDKLLTCWLLSPGVFSFLVFALLFGFAYVLLCKRWGAPIALGTFLAIAVCGGIIVNAFTLTSFFDQYAAERYMGASLALAFLLGAAAFSYDKDAVPPAVRGIAVGGVLAEVIVNWFANGGIFGAVAFACLPCFGLGVLAGFKIPHRKKTEEEKKAEALAERMRLNAQRNPVAERRERTRKNAAEGFNEAKQARFDMARQLLRQSMLEFLQEQPFDQETFDKFVEKLTSPNLFIDIPSIQWLEWGDAAKAKNSPQAALLLLEKGLLQEKNANIARRALYNIGEIRLTCNLEPDDGVARLKKVIDLNGADLLAVQARKLLDKFSKM